MPSVCGRHVNDWTFKIWKTISLIVSCLIGIIGIVLMAIGRSPHQGIALQIGGFIMFIFSFVFIAILLCVIWKHTDYDDVMYL